VPVPGWARLRVGLVGPTWVFDPLGAAVRLPAVGLCLFAGILSGQTLWGCLAAGGAFTCGFGAPLSLAGSRPLLLLTACAAITFAAVAGSVASAPFHGWLVVPLLGLVGGLCGYAATRGPGWGWLTLQGGLAAIVATSYPATWERAGLRAGAISAGGLVQAAFLLAAAWARWRAQPASPGDAPEASHVWRLAVGLALGAAVARAAALPNGYWVPLTILLVLRPDPNRTLARILARVAGTVAGALTASAVVLVARPSHHALAVLVLASAFGAYLFQKATYGLFSAAVTLYVVFMLSFIGLDEEHVAVARVLATLIGGALALAMVGVEASVRRRTRGR